MLTLKDPSLLRQQCYLNGEWRDADSGEIIPVTNPATDAVIATVPKMGAQETRRAIEAAQAAVNEFRDHAELGNIAIEIRRRHDAADVVARHLPDGWRPRDMGHGIIV